MGRALRSAALVLLVDMMVVVVVHHGGPALARSPKGGASVPEPPDLRKSFARRLKRLLGVPVSIDSLRYNLFASTFLGRGVRVGPATRPHLDVARLRVKVKVSLLQPGGRTVRLVEAAGVKVDIPLEWLGRRAAMPATAGFDVGRLRVKGQIRLREPKNEVLIEGVEITGSGLSARRAKSGVFPALTGRLTLSAKRLKLGALVVDGVRIEGRLERRRTLRIEQIALRVAGGEVSLSGTARLGRRRLLDRIALEGEVSKVRLIGDTPLSGKIKVGGRWGRGLTISGKLRPDGSRVELAPTRGRLSGNLPIKVRLGLRLGKRRLSGSLRRWRLR